MSNSLLEMAAFYTRGGDTYGLPSKMGRKSGHNPTDAKTPHYWIVCSPVVRCLTYSAALFIFAISFIAVSKSTLVSKYPSGIITEIISST